MAEYRAIASMNIDLKELEEYKEAVKVKHDGKTAHWGQVSKRVMTLFQVLMDSDLKDLVEVLKRYPEYIELICEHFRYSYSYSETEGDLQAASELLFMSTEFHESKKQFVRNLLRKCERIHEYDLKELGNFIERLGEIKEGLHPIFSDYYSRELHSRLEVLGVHKLQRLALMKKANFLQENDSFDFRASDKDFHMDIPYMN